MNAAWTSSNVDGYGGCLLLLFGSDWQPAIVAVRDNGVNNTSIAAVFQELRINSSHPDAFVHESIYPNLIIWTYVLMAVNADCICVRIVASA